MSVIHVNKENFEQLKKEQRPVLLDFYADWCGPCKMVAPIIEQIADERPDIAVAKVNVDDQPELAGAFGVFSIPTLVVMKDGEVVQKSAGARPKEAILELIDG
ncbi:MAG: thioredoxin [Clostridia bacterium]|nr:thioredoxin [Clostridia bacterium]